MSLFLLGINLGVELLVHMIILCLIFWGTKKLFFEVPVPCYIPTSKVWWFLFLNILVNTCDFVFLIKTILLCVKQYVCFWFAFLWWQWCWTSFHVVIGHLYIFFQELSIEILCSFLKMCDIFIAHIIKNYYLSIIFIYHSLLLL